MASWRSHWRLLLRLLQLLPAAPLRVLLLSFFELKGQTVLPLPLPLLILLILLRLLKLLLVQGYLRSKVLHFELLLLTPLPQRQRSVLLLLPRRQHLLLLQVLARPVPG